MEDIGGDISNELGETITGAGSIRERENLQEPKSGGFIPHS